MVFGFAQLNLGNIYILVLDIAQLARITTMLRMLGKIMRLFYIWDQLAERRVSTVTKNELGLHRGVRELVNKFAAENKICYLKVKFYEIKKIGFRR